MPTAPFHFDGTVFNPSHFPARCSAWEPGTHWQTLRWAGAIYGLRLRHRGTVAHPAIDLVLYARSRPPGATIDAITAEISYRFDLESTGVPEFVRRFRADPVVGPCIRRRPGMRMADILSLYEYLVITVMLQNTAVRRSVSMLQALFERCGRRVRFDGRDLWGFWDPVDLHRVPEEDLRGLKVGYRAAILKRQAAQFVAGEIDERALRQVRDREALVAALDRIYGVGPQSAGYMLGEYFHFYDGVDHISPWEAGILARLLWGREADPEAILAFMTERYGPFRLLAGHYLFVDLFWQHHRRPIPWLAEMIRL